MSFLRDKYNNEIIPGLIEDFDYSNKMKVPELEKVVINMGLGEAVRNPGVIDTAMDELEAITGQQPVVTKARRSIAGFNLRKGAAIGAKVTLRERRMYEFLERLIYVALPRVRDFEGISRNAFDGHGNYTLGLEEQIIFPEIDYDSVDSVRGMSITMVTTAETDEEALSLLDKIGLPFEKTEQQQ
jgi:large subunit ribosomal protein L5